VAVALRVPLVVVVVVRKTLVRGTKGFDMSSSSSSSLWDLVY